MHKNQVLEEINQNLHQTTKDLISKNKQIASRASLSLNKEELKHTNDKIDPNKLK